MSVGKATRLNFLSEAVVVVLKWIWFWFVPSYYWNNPFFPQEVTWQTVLHCVFGPLWRAELSSRLSDFRRCPLHPLVNGEHFKLVTIRFRNSSGLSVSSCGSCSQQGFGALGVFGANLYLLLFLSADSKSLLLVLWKPRHLELNLHLSQCIML